MKLLAFDTSTPATVVIAGDSEGEVFEARHDPHEGERPGHTPQLLGLIEDALTRAGLEWDQVERIGVGVGPGSFTGLRVGVATARALAQARGIPLVAIKPSELTAGTLCKLTAEGGESLPEAILPDYQKAPNARMLK
jgi:tRNA threonylcarbamoyladenosine biosynthesis protein TsaB